jgi:hypothetical protein
MDFHPWYEFDKCINRYKGDYKVQKIDCWPKFLVMCFAQISSLNSLRDIEVCLDTVSNKLYHSWIRHKVSRLTLADANEQRDWRIYGNFAQFLIPVTRRLNLRDSGFTLVLDNMVYTLESTTIDLCLALFPWAHFQSTKGHVKAHTLLTSGDQSPPFLN